MTPDRVARLEGAHNYLSAPLAERLLEAIDRLEHEGAGNAKRAEEARAEIEAEDAEAGS